MDASARGALVLRRTTFGPLPGALEAALDAHGSPEGIRDAALDAPPRPLAMPASIDEPFDVDDATVGNEELVMAWLEHLADPEAGLHDKLAWFWHAHLPTSFTKAAGLYCWRQVRTFYQHALGNFGDLLKAICVDAAMLQYLDGSGSEASDPNENLGRELLELFSLGRGAYTEDDVRAAAKALAGWTVSTEDNGTRREPFATLQHPVTFLGKTARFDPDLLVDQILAQDATAPHLVGKLATYLVGDGTDPALLAEWAALLRSTGYEIRPVVDAILRSDALWSGTRARNGIEWLCTTVRALGIDMPQSLLVSDIAQVPYYPPNVAGWPDRWLDTSSLYARAAFIYGATVPPLSLDRADPATSALARCGIYGASATTVEALRAVAARHPDEPARLVQAALLSPELAIG